ncbi:MAG: hypothetical protein NTX25_09310 [Proteobacteria bacterium]|nr:hypothetical protein [Pseudomonadota bacterium]
MTTKPKKKNKSKSMAFLEKLNNGPLSFAQQFSSISEGEEMTQEDFGRCLKDTSDWCSDVSPEMMLSLIIEQQSLFLLSKIVGRTTFVPTVYFP